MTIDSQYLLALLLWATIGVTGLIIHIFNNEDDDK